jgi:hypothetical protein
VVPAVLCKHIDTQYTRFIAACSAVFSEQNSSAGGGACEHIDVCDDVDRSASYGMISTIVRPAVRSHRSCKSSSASAMQPLVQSRVR